MGLVALTFDLLTSKVGNLPSKIRHTKPLGSQIIRYVRDRRTHGQKQRLLPLP